MTTVSAGTIIDGSCLTDDPSPLNARVLYHYAVNDLGAIVARGRVLSDGPFSDPLDDHLLLLLPRPATCSGDANRDGSVDFTDLLIVLGSWGSCVNCAWCQGDLDADRQIGFGDLLVVLSQWSADCVTFDGPPQTVQDCIDRVGFDPVALEACINALGNQ